jgi:hypothetical protein
LPHAGAQSAGHDPQISSAEQQESPHVRAQSDGQRQLFSVGVPQDPSPQYGPQSGAEPIASPQSQVPLPVE